MENAVTMRIPEMNALLPDFQDAAKALVKVTLNGSVPTNTTTLMFLRAGQIVGNTYLTAMHTSGLRKEGENEERISAVASWRDAVYFTGAERVALALVEAVLTPNPDGERVSDELYAEASAHYDDKALATLILAISQVCFFIPLALIGKPLAGVSPSVQWR